MTDAPSADPFKFKRRGILFVVSSPSGAGKSTISRKLLAADNGLEMSVSATTRPMRPGEVDGVDYHFVDLPKFREMVANHEFLEWAHVFGHRYGTPHGAVEQALSEGRDVLFDIDWQGAQQLYQLAGGDVVRVFIFPPSMEELERRLRARRTDSDEVIAGRMTQAASEISHWDGYDYVLVNDDVESCFTKVQTILEAERTKRSRQAGLKDWLRNLQPKANDERLETFIFQLEAGKTPDFSSPEALLVKKDLLNATQGVRRQISEALERGIGDNYFESNDELLPTVTELEPNYGRLKLDELEARLSDLEANVRASSTDASNLIEHATWLKRHSDLMRKDHPEFMKAFETGVGKELGEGIGRFIPRAIMAIIGAIGLVGLIVRLLTLGFL